MQFETTLKRAISSAMPRDRPMIAELGGHVIGLTEIADQAGVDAMGTKAKGLLAEKRGDGAAHDGTATENYGNHIRPIRPAHLVEDHVAKNADIVDQDVDAAIGVERSLDDGFCVLRLGDQSVEAIASPLAFLTASTVSCAGPLSLPAPCKLAPRYGKPSRERLPLASSSAMPATDTAPRARDDGNFPFDNI